MMKMAIGVGLKIKALTQVCTIILRVHDDICVWMATG